VAVQGAGQHLHGGNEEAVGLGEQGDGGEEFDFHDKRYEGEARGRGESEGLSCCLTRRFCPSILADVDVIKYQFHDISQDS
jgi:hypothetical protein